MPAASYTIGSFLGGEISDFAQGRWDKPDYRISMKVCLNGFPNEIGTWVRRPGSHHAGHTRRGAAARVVKFDYRQAGAVTLEFTDGWLRFRDGLTLVVTNDTVGVTAISTASPAVVQTAAAVLWATNDTLIFPGATTALLENRQFTATKVDTTHFSLADAITGNALDGSALGALPSSALVTRVQELATSYTGGLWSGIRAVQAEKVDILLCASVAPQALTVTIPAPIVGNHPVFAIAPATFNDGPYLDPFSNGVQAVPGGKTGVVTLTLSFPAYDATKAYKIGDFITSAGVNYISLVNQNVGSAPPSANWSTTSVSAAINGGSGFLGTDIGRLVRLFSEPAAWAAGTAYTASTAATPVIVSYNPTGDPGATLYYQAAQNSTGKVPGTDLTNWTLVPQGAAIWSWGKIVSLSNIIDRALAGSASIGDMTAGGGLAAAFDGVFTQAAAACAERVSGAAATSLSSYVGKNYSGATDQIVQSATIYPSSNNGFAYLLTVGDGGTGTITLTLNLRGRATLPVSAADGTLLGTSGSIANTLSAITIISNDQTTAWKYVWVEQISVGSLAGTITNSIAELSLFNPAGTGTGTGVNVQLLGPPLLYTQPIATWRLGVYSDTTGYPTCGTYYEGRIWLGGAVNNRLDACMSNKIDGGTINFAPTNQYGVVAADSAITYVLNADSTNPMFWMQPEEKGIVIGTQAGEFLVVAPTNGPLAPTNIAARRVAKIGCANVEPRRTEHTLIFVKRYRRKLMEFFADANFGKFSGPNIADKAGHIVSAGVAEIAYTEAVVPVIWGRTDAGALFGVTYKRDTLTTSQPPTFAGFHRHTLGSGRTIESICNGPSVGGDLDALTMVTSDSSGVRHVEIITDTPNENAALADSWFLDNAVNPSSTSSTLNPAAGSPFGGLTLNGLWHLNGKTVQVFAGGLDCGDRGPGTTGYTDFVVTNGSVLVPYGDSISSGPGRGLFTSDFAAALATSKIVVGFTYNSDGQVLRPMTPADSGARNGPAFAKISRGHRYGMKVVNTLGVSVGGDLTKKMYPAKFPKAKGDPIPALTAYSGIIQDTLQDDYGYEGGAPAWRIARPWPANIVIVGDNLSSQDQ